MLTLMSVAKPWIEASPVPESQTDCGVPGMLFSHAIGLTSASTDRSVAEADKS